MALSDKNILIIPATNTTGQPLLRFTAGTASFVNTITFKVLDSGPISIEGNSGQLMSIVDSTTGTIYSVNDVSGIPSIEVLDTGLIRLAPYNGAVIVGSKTLSTSTAKFEVYGTAGQLFSIIDSSTGTLFSAADVSGLPSIEVLDTGLVKLAQYGGTVGITTGTTISPVTVYTSTYILSLGVGVSASNVIGEVRATGTVTQNYSDRRLKERVEAIRQAVTKVLSLNGVTYYPNDLAASYGYDKTKRQVGLFADEVESVLPDIVKPAPFDHDSEGRSVSGNNYKTVQYEKIVPLLVEAIKEQQLQIDQLEEKVKKLQGGT